MAIELPEPVHIGGIVALPVTWYLLVIHDILAPLLIPFWYLGMHSMEFSFQLRPKRVIYGR